MKLIVYRYPGQAFLFLGAAEVKDLKEKQKLMEINGYKFLATISYKTYIGPEATGSRSASITIPKKVADYLKLKHKQEVEVKIL